MGVPRIAAAALCVALTACTTTTDPVPPPASSTPRPAAASEGKCRLALQADFRRGWPVNSTDVWPPATRKPVCAGIDYATLNRLMSEALDGVLTPPVPSAPAG